MADHYGNHRCLIEKNIPIALYPIFSTSLKTESRDRESPQAVNDNQCDQIWRNFATLAKNKPFGNLLSLFSI